MIITEKFINWFEKQDRDTYASLYNFAMLTFSSLSFFDRVTLAIEIILGKKFCLYRSRKQKPMTNEELLESDIIEKALLKKKK